MQASIYPPRPTRRPSKEDIHPMVTQPFPTRRYKLLVTGWALALFLTLTLFPPAFITSAHAAPTAVAGAADKAGPSAGKDQSKKQPNILFIILDDVGIDQMKIFGYGGLTPPSTPNIDAIAHAGVRFRNTWAMPECSPSRSAVFTGRWPLRTGVQAVVSPTVLANSQVSPYEVTTPKVLKMLGASYESAMFGKFHLAGPDNYPYGNGGPHSL